MPVEMKKELIKPVMEKEIVVALKQLGDNKAPDIDGFNARFFKASWSVVGKDVTDAVKEFFQKKKMYRAINCTLVALIPKKHDAKNLKDMSPLACCSLII